MPEAANGGVLQKKVFLKMPQISEETPVSGEAPVYFATILRTPFLQNNSGQLILKCGHFNNEARDIDCIFCRELDVMLIAYLTIQLSWASA